MPHYWPILLSRVSETENSTGGGRPRYARKKIMQYLYLPTATSQWAKILIFESFFNHTLQVYFDSKNKFDILKNIYFTLQKIFIFNMMIIDTVFS